MCWTLCSITGAMFPCSVTTRMAEATPTMSLRSAPCCGATLGGPRYIWWNFVSSSQQKIEAAKEEWRKGDWGRGQFALPPDDRNEFTPLPDR